MASSAQSVSALSILCMCVTLLICFGGPIGLAIWAKVKYKKAFSFLPLLLGVVGFTLFQIIIRVNFMLPLIQNSIWFKSNIALPWVQWLYATFLCITAGLFEEPVRFLAFTILKKKRQYPDGLSYGIGHGGIEAILIVGLTYVNNIIFSVAINSGTWGKLISAIPAALQPQYAQLQQSLVNASPDLFLIGGLERLFTMAIQIAFSVMIAKGFMVNKKWLYLIAATILHALVDFSLVSLQMLHVNMWLIEAVIMIEAVVGLIYIIKQAKDWRRNLQQAEGAVLPN